MKDFALDRRDLEIANGDFALCHDEAHAIAQAISIRLKTFSGEWFLDTRVGLPYDQSEKFFARIPARARTRTQSIRIVVRHATGI